MLKDRYKINFIDNICDTMLITTEKELQMLKCTLFIITIII